MSEVPENCRKQIKTKKVFVNYLIFTLYQFILQEGYVYLRWLGILDKQDKYIYTASGQAKIVLFQDASNDNFPEEKTAM